MVVMAMRKGHDDFIFRTPIGTELCDHPIKIAICKYVVVLVENELAVARK